MPARQEEDEGEKSSPDDSYIDLESENTNVSITSDDMYMIMVNTGRQSTDGHIESPSRMIHQESMPEFNNPQLVQQPRKSSLPDIVNPTSVPIPRMPFSRVPEESDEYDSSSNSSSTMARQFQLPKEGFNVKLKKVPPQLPVASKTQPNYAMATKPKPKPGVPPKNK